jgi:hypothetical protein
LSIDDILMGMDGKVKIVGLDYYTHNKNYNLISEHGSILAQDILVSTICEDYLPNVVDFKKTLEFWRETHEFKP